METKQLNTVNNEAFLTPEMFVFACDNIAIDIQNIITSKNIDVEDVGLIGVARGGLPLMVGVSHRTGIRECSTIQIKMNKSDNKDDYGIAHLISANIAPKKYYFIFEDIIFKGQSINLVMDYLKDNAKNVLSIYSLVCDKGFDESSAFQYDKSLVKYSYALPQNDWTYFFWEKGYPKNIKSANI